MKARPVGDRFWEKVDVRGPEDCWPWTAHTDPAGYGRIQFGRASRKAHRVSYMLATGEALCQTDFICHKCDNPPCVNPRHLFKGTAAMNSRDMAAKGRAHAQKLDRALPTGERHANHKLTDQAVREIRRLCAQGATQREVASMFGINQSVVSQVVNGLRWRHVA